MEGQNAPAPDPAPQTGETIRQRSTISFPYDDLNAGIELANAIHAHVGRGDCDDDQLAAWVGKSAKSSSFRAQIYAARTFGILDGEGSKHKLSDLGHAIVDPHQAREARVRAFLNVPLYKAVFENHKGGVLPPAAALEREMVTLGVAEKQKGRARQVFERAADQAGFSEHGKNRLVMPGVPRTETLTSEGDKGKGGGGNGEGGGDDLPQGTDPIIAGLLKRLPKVGEVWPDAQRKLWLQLLEGSFKLIYKDEGDRCE